MANIVVTATPSNVNVTTTLSNIRVTDSETNTSFNISTTTNAVSVTTVQSNINVSQSIAVSNNEIRAAISNVFPILYDVTNGIISIDEDAINIANAIVNGNITLRQFQETVYNHGNVNSGILSVNIANGTIHTARLTGNLDQISFSNLSIGGSATIILRQDDIGHRHLNTTHSSWNNWLFVGQVETIDLDPNTYNAISVTYDGTNYYAAVATFGDSVIENSQLANSNIIINGQTFNLGDNSNLTNFIANTTMQQNLTVAGTITGQAIQSNTTLSANGIISTNTYVNTPSLNLGTPNTSDEKEIVAYGAGGTEATAGILVYDANDANETGKDGVWKFTNDTAIGTYYKLPTSTTDLAEGTNLYFTAARARGNISVTDAGGDGSLGYNNTTGVFTYTGPSSAEVRAHFSATSPITYSSSTGVIGLSGTANITTTGNISGGYILGNGAFLTGVAIPYGNSNVANFLINGYGSNNITTTGVITAGTLTATANIITTPANAVITGDTTTDDLHIQYDQITLAIDNSTVGDDSLRVTNARDGSVLFQVGPDLTNLSPNSGTRVTGDLYVGTDNAANVTGTFYVRSNTGDVNTKGGVEADGQIRTDSTGLAIYAPVGNIETGQFFIGNGSQLTGMLTNAQVVSYIATQPLTVGGNLTVNGNINATGNINVQNVEDLYVRDQTIVMNANAASPANVQIVSNRPGFANTELKWNEQTGRWTFTNDGTTYYNLATSTTDIPEGANLYFSNSRVNAFIQDNITTTDIDEGANLYYTVGRANTAIDNRVTKSFVEGLGVSYTSLTDKPTIPTHTSNLINDSGYITTANANVISVNGETGVVSLDTTDIPEGSNLYYTTDRANTWLAGKTTTDLTEGANLYYTTDRANTWLAGKTTTDLTEGANLYFTTDRANSAIGAYQGSISTAGNISTTGNLSVGNIVNVTNIEGTGPFATITMNSINPKEIILGQDFGSKIFFPYNGQILASVGQYLRVDSVAGPGATLALKNFGLSYQSIGTFGGPGDPANISFSQSASVTKAELRGDVGDINVSGVATGDTGWIVIAQDVTGGRQLTLGSSWKMEGCTTGNPVPIALGANEETLIFWTYDGTNYRGTVHPNIGSNVSVDIKTTGNIVGGNANITNAVNAATVNATNVNGTTVTATTANATTVNGTTVNANTIATLAASNTVSINANVNANGNIVANASLVTVTNGNNIILDNERNLGLLIDRNNNSANVTVTTLSGVNYRGGDSPDRIVFSAPLPGYTDGQPVTISGFTNATVAGALNGNVFYLRQLPFNPVRYVIFSDPDLTTGVNLAVTNINAGPGAVTYTRRNFVTPKEWSLNVDQVNNDLRIKEDGTTRVTVESGGNLNITGTANANSVVISQPGTAGTYANVIPIDSVAGVSPGSSSGFDSPSNVLVQIYESGQQFPIGNIYQLTFSGVTGPGNVNLNGQTFWSNGVDISGYADVTQLFLDSAATIPANATVLGVTSQTVGGNVSFNFTPGTAGNNWQLSSVNGNLNIAHNGTVVGNVNSAGNLTITGRHTYDRVYGEFYHSANINPVAADTIYAFPLDTTTISSDVLVNNTSRINIVKPGTFKLFMSLQVKNNNNSADHLMRFWLRKNGVDVAGSATVITPLKLQEQVVSMHWMVESDGDDYFEIVYYVNDTNVVFPNYAAITSPVTAPQAPPIIVNVLPVGA